MLNVEKIRDIFKEKYKLDKFEENDTIEILNSSFIADEPVIFGTLNKEYQFNELSWYLSQSLNVNTIKKPIPKIWKNISGNDGEINSNYGWCIFSDENGNQLFNALSALIQDKSSRRSTMIYLRTSMHNQFNNYNMSDFVCTYSVQLFIRSGKLFYHVYMRSNDAIFGYKNDFYWHNFVFDMSINILRNHYPNLEKGELYWNSASLHIYKKHYNLIK